jgi:hypothetical protein
MLGLLGSLPRPAAADTHPLDRVDYEDCGAVRPAELDLPARTLKGDFDPGTAGFAVKIRDDVIPYRLMSFFVLPGETVELEAVLGVGASRFEACAKAGTLERTRPDRWKWTAPAARGTTAIHLTDPLTGETMTLRAFVLDRYAGERQLNGYRIGDYQKVPLYDNPVYDVPRGLLRVEEPEMLDIWISPHFQLRQFLCKQGSGFPEYVIVRERMLLKLELLLEKANEGGIETLTFAVLSGFRTPHYNLSIGNRTKYSRHTYGDAADIYLDEDGDGRMDDINGDGVSDYKDAIKLASIIEDNFDASWYEPFIGGLGIYGPKPHRGSFIHVDTRGFRARWNQP